MIVLAAIDAEALRERSEAVGDVYYVLKHLAKVLRQHGVIQLTGREDAKQLFDAVESLDPAIRETWAETLTALGSAGRIRRGSSNTPTNASCMANPLAAANLVPSDLVVLGDSACDVQGVLRPPGHLQRTDEPELSAAAAVPTCRTIERIDDLVHHPYTRQGESREHIWTHYMEPLARVADEVRVLDRYLFTRFFKTRDLHDLGHIDWLLTRLNEGIPGGTNVLLLAENVPRKPSEPNEEWRTRRAEAAAELGRWLRAHTFVRDRPGALQVSLSPWREVETDDGQLAGRPHDRHIRFTSWVALATPEGFSRVTDEAVIGEDGMVLNRVMATNDAIRNDYFASLIRKEDAVLRNADWQWPRPNRRRRR